jgi:predicted transglutaminase-like cysteine proteinase
MYRLVLASIIAFILALSGCSGGGSSQKQKHDVLHIASWQSRETFTPSYKGEYLPIDAVGMHEIREISRELSDRWTDISDPEKWGAKDYYQTSEESLRDMSGDCDDYATLLYIMLLDAGYPPDCLAVISFLMPPADGEIDGHADLCVFPDGFDGEFHRVFAGQSRSSLYLEGWTPIAGFTLDSYWLY